MTDSAGLQSEENESVWSEFATPNPELARAISIQRDWQTFAQRRAILQPQAQLAAAISIGLGISTNVDQDSFVAMAFQSIIIVTQFGGNSLLRFPQCPWTPAADPRCA